MKRERGDAGAERVVQETEEDPAKKVIVDPEKYTLDYTKIGRKESMTYFCGLSQGE